MSPDNNNGFVIELDPVDLGLLSLIKHPDETVESALSRLVSERLTEIADSLVQENPKLN